jgi:hypothetical protein
MTKRVYNKELLDETLKRDGATLIGEYEKLNREIIISFICKCGNIHKKNFRAAYTSNMLCIECTNKSRELKREKTCLEKFGYKSATENKDVQLKQRETCRKNLGCDYPTQNTKTIEKQAETCISKYGYKTNLQDPLTKLQIKETNKILYGTENPSQNTNVKEKIKNTIKTKYGVEHHLQLNDILQKQYNTNIEKYGTHIASLNLIVQKKIKKTNIEKYGFETPLQNEEVKNKIKATNLEKYGVEHPNQSPEIQEKTQKNAKKFKEYTFPSGNIRKVQGYEPLALDELIKGGYTEEQILTERKEVPHIQYEVDGKKRYYFPDIHIPHENRIIEVKSTWTYKCKTDNIELKKQSCIDAGYKYEIWCYDSKKNRVEV